MRLSVHSLISRCFLKIGSHTVCLHYDVIKCMRLNPFHLIRIRLVLAIHAILTAFLRKPNFVRISSLKCVNCVHTENAVIY